MRSIEARERKFLNPVDYVVVSATCLLPSIIECELYSYEPTFFYLATTPDSVAMNHPDHTDDESVFSVCNVLQLKTHVGGEACRTS